MHFVKYSHSIRYLYKNIVKTKIYLDTYNISNIILEFIF